METIGRRLTERREAVGLTKGQIAKYEGITPQYYGQIENSSKGTSTWPLLGKLALRLRTSSDYLLGISDDPAPPSVRELPPHGAEMLDVLRRVPLSVAQMLVTQAQAALACYEVEEQRLADSAAIRAVIGDEEADALGTAFALTLERYGEPAAIEQYHASLRRLFGEDSEVMDDVG